MLSRDVNFISQLKEFHDSTAKKRRAEILEPKTFFCQFGPDNAPIFDCLCVYLNFSTSGEGGTKKEAEQDAKEQMLEYARDAVASVTGQQLPEPLHITRLHHKLDEYQRSVSAFERTKNPAAKVLADAFIFKSITCIIFDEVPFVCTPKAASELREHILANGRCSRMDRIALGCLLCNPQCDLAFMQELFSWDVHHAVSILSDAESFALRTRDATGSKSRTRTTLIDNFIGKLKDATGMEPTYIDHDVRSPSSGLFRCDCQVRGLKATGEGRQKKVAKQDAARAMLKKIACSDAVGARTVVRRQTISGGNESKFKIFKPTEIFEIAQKIGWTANLLDPQCEHLIAAFTHSSASGLNNYEYLEHLGDALLKLIVVRVVSRHLGQTLTNTDTFSNKIDEIISGDTALRVAKNKLDLGKHVFVLVKGSVEMDSILADVLEALIAALWLSEKGTTSVSTEHEEAVEYTVARWFKDDIVKVFGPLDIDFPSLPPCPFGIYSLSLNGTLGNYDLHDMIELWLTTDVLDTRIVKQVEGFMQLCIVTAPIALGRSRTLTLRDAPVGPPSLRLEVRNWEVKKRVSKPRFVNLPPGISAALRYVS